MGCARSSRRPSRRPSSSRSADYFEKGLPRPRLELQEARVGGRHPEDVARHLPSSSSTTRARAPTGSWRRSSTSSPRRTDSRTTLSCSSAWSSRSGSTRPAAALDLEKELLAKLEAGEPTPKVAPEELKKRPPPARPRRPGDEDRREGHRAATTDSNETLPAPRTSPPWPRSSRGEEGSIEAAIDDLPLHQQEIARILSDANVDSVGLDLDDVLNKVENWSWRSTTPSTCSSTTTAASLSSPGTTARCLVVARRAMFKSDAEALPAKVFKGTEEEAIFFGQVEGEAEGRARRASAPTPPWSLPRRPARASASSPPCSPRSSAPRLSRARRPGPVHGALTAGSEGQPRSSGGRGGLATSGNLSRHDEHARSARPSTGSTGREKWGGREAAV